MKRKINTFQTGTRTLWFHKEKRCTISYDKKKHALNSTSIYVFCQEKMASPSGDRLDVEDYVLDEIFSEWGDSPPIADSDNGR